MLRETDWIVENGDLIAATLFFREVFFSLRTLYMELI